MCVNDRIDIYVTPQALRIDTGHYNPHSGHYCTLQTTGVDLQQFSEADREALVTVDAFAAELGMKVDVHFVNDLRTRLRLLRKAVLGTPAVFVRGQRIWGPVTRGKLLEALDLEDTGIPSPGRTPVEAPPR
jgi:hypothetical protein